MSLSLLLAAVSQMLMLGLQVGPDLWAAVEAAIVTAKGGSAPTPDQQAQIDAALNVAHAALQMAA